MGAGAGQGRPPGGATVDGRGNGRPPADRPPLTGDDVLEAAMEIARTDGPGALTIRALAARLGVAVTAVYWHVGGKQAVLDGLADRVIAELGEVSVRGRGPEARVISIGRSLRRTLLERSDLVGLVHQQGRTAALFQPARRVLVRELAAAGLQGDQTARAVQALLHLVIGSVLVDRQVARQPAQRETPAQLWTSDHLPGSPRALGELTTPAAAEALFDYTLGVLVRAVIAGPGPSPGEAGARPPPAARPGRV